MASLNSSLQDLRARLGKLGPQLELGKLGKLELGNLGKLDLSKLGRGRGGRRSGGQLVTGLDIEPGQVIAAEVHLNGGVEVQRAAGVPIPSDVVRDGEVADVEALTEALKTVFAQHKLSRRVRVGVANQRIMVRTLEFPPIPDERELDAAVRFRAQDEIPMPPDTVVLDYHSLGVVDTGAGPRQRVMLVAARRDMVERLLTALEGAGLRPEGIDLSAFALIRSLHQPGSDPEAPVLYLHLSGLTNLVVARGVSCVFTRVLGTGLEAIATSVAERCVVPIDEARALIFRIGLASEGPVDVQAPALDPPVLDAPVLDPPVLPVQGSADETPVTAESEDVALQQPPLEVESPVAEPVAEPRTDEATEGAQSQPSAGGLERPLEPVAETPDHFPGEPQSTESFAAEPEADVSHESAPDAGLPPDEPGAASELSPADLERVMTIRSAISDGLRLIVAEVRNSLDYHLGHVGGKSDRPVERVVLSGPAVGIPGLLSALQDELKLPLVAGEVAVSDSPAAAGVPVSRLAVAAGLAVSEVKP